MPPEPSAAWQTSATSLGRLVGASLATHGGSARDVTVRVLGTRDELAAGDAVPSETAGKTAGESVRVHVYGHQAVLGPFRDTRPCDRCLARRWQAVRFPALRDALELGSGVSAVGEPAFATPFVADLVASVAAAHLDTDRPGDGDASPFAPVYHLDLDRLLVRQYRLVPDPECPQCGRRRGDSEQEATLTLHPALKPSPASFRVRDLDEYDVAVDAFANPVCGAVGPTVMSDLASVSTAAVSGGFSTRSGSYLRQTLWGGHADSYADSTRIGVLEGLERYAGIRPRARATSVVASLEQLNRAGSRALDPRACGVYSDDFYRTHPEVRPFSPAREIGWVWGYSLRDQQPVLVPEVLAHYQAQGRRERFVQASSNGCATGGCLEEAIYHGLMEAVERDAFLLAWYGGAALPEIDPQSSSRSRTREMVDRLAMYGYDARFFDTRITFPIPVVTAVAVRRDGGLGALCVGGGAGLDPEAALSAALCEIATDSVNLRERTERDEQRLRAMAADFDLVQELHDHPLMYGNPDMAVHASFLLGGPAVSRSAPLPMAAVFGPDRPAPPLSPDLKSDLEWCLDAVTGKGFDVVVVDQTLPEQRDLGLVTVNVIVPGLLPIDFGWPRQRALHMPRLRSALREAGLTDHDLQPHELHRVPHPFP